ncbi:NUDIX hydrolase [Lapillicoccus jejuensis]|uniref:ADP-ribose pyrophosphatase YjhB (NUDIX family) n=1 Tax=Lapillicoccus jejuensis TaxID=402171 RepID=A0A542DX58_9MICO|nr:NUDIX domain-containing protein [Lapillicoccus jejuensis]TQJ07666.1 ADP-ribose pyrophosphatase YjhB (NUDIX family) [Lapillicoccus jejuensis]
MPTPDFILALRDKVGTMPLWLSGAAAVVVRDRQDAGGEEVLLVQRSDTLEWTPVTGIVDPGEEPAVTAVRECLEEACVVARADRLVWVTVSPVITYANGDESQYLELVFRCSWVSGEPAVGDDESVDARWFPVDALPPMSDRHAERVRLALANAPETVFTR